MEQIERIQKMADLIGIPHSKLQARVGVDKVTWWHWRKGTHTPRPENLAKLNEVEEWLDRMIAATGA